MDVTKAKIGLEPLPSDIDKGNETNWNVKDARSKGCYSCKYWLLGGIEDLIVEKALKTALR